MPSNVDNTLASAIIELLSADKTKILPGLYEFNQTVTLKIIATVKKSEDSDVPATSNIPFKSVLALMFQNTKEKTTLLKLFRDSLKKVFVEGKELENKLTEGLSDYENNVEKVKSSLVDLPRVKKSGQTRVNGSIELIKQELDNSPF